MNELALFAGAGGGLLASRLLGWRTVCAVEIDAYARKSLFARQRDGMLERFPIWDDIKTFDGKQWRNSVEVVSGGFPCQDISQAGTGKGLAGNRSGLFFEMLRVVDEVRPRFVFAENSPNLRTKGLVTIVKEFNRLGYDTRWCVLGAWHAGAPHRRNRMWILSHTDRQPVRNDKQRHKKWSSIQNSGQAVIEHNGKAQSMAHADSARKLQQKGPFKNKRQRFSNSCENDGNANSAGFKKQRGRVTAASKIASIERSSWWTVEPELGRMAHGVASRVDRLRCIGNGQVPAVAACAWRMLTFDLEVEQ